MVCVAAVVVGVRSVRSGAEPQFPRSSAVVAPVPSLEPTRCTQNSAIAQLPLRRRLAQMIMVGVDAHGPQQALAAVTSEQVGGIFLAGSATGLLSGHALQQVQDTAVLPVAVAVDDEGGRVQRIDALDGPLPSARWMAANLPIEQVFALAFKRGSQLLARGVNIDFVPSVDVSSQPNNAVIGDRSFSSDPQTVTRYAGAFAQGLRAAGVLPVFKHFPGHGRATGDSHRGAVSTPPLTELREVTDDLSAMAAITDRADLPEAVRRSLTAGVDMALWITTNRLAEVLEHLEKAVTDGSLPESRVNEAVAHVLRAKTVDLCSTRSY